MNNIQQRIVANQTEIIHLITSGVSLKEILLIILKGIESYDPSIPPIYGAVMLYNQETEKLEHYVSTSIPKPMIEKMKEIAIGPKEGSCGAAAYLKKPVITSNIKESSNWKGISEFVLKYGFKACWSTPILSVQKELLGTFALYFKEVYEKNNTLMKVIEIYHHLATIAIELSKDIISETEQPRNYLIVNEYNINNSDIQRALSQEEFEVYYQPYYNLKGDATGIEALIRWNHPQEGLLNPGSFLSVIEESNFILKMEEWVLCKAIRETKQLHKLGMKYLTLSVNISAKQFANPNFPYIISSVLKHHSFPPKNLTLEVTERFIFDQENMDTLLQIKELGVQISIDDFGTSYSSLQYLKDLPIDEIKIDRTFISNIDTNENNQKIVEMIIRLANQLGVTIVVEGVETKEQFEWLQHVKCHRVQGYLFSKPIPFEQLKKCMKKR